MCCFLYQEKPEDRGVLEPTESQLQFLQTLRVWNFRSVPLKLFTKTILHGKGDGGLHGKVSLEENQGPPSTCSFWIPSGSQLYEHTYSHSLVNTEEGETRADIVKE